MPYLVWTGLACVLAVHGRPMARDRRCVQRPPGALRHAGRRQRPGRARHSRRRQLHRRAAEQAVGPHGQQGVQPVGSEPQRPRPELDAPLQIMVFAQEPDFPPLPGRLKEYEYTSEAGDDGVHRSRTRSRPSRGRTRSSSTARSSSTTRDAPSGSRLRRAGHHRTGHHQRASSRSVTGQQRKVYFVQGHGERDTARSERGRLQRDRRAHSAAKTTWSTSSCSRRPGRRARRCVGRDRRRSEDRFLPGRDRGAQDVSREGGQAAAGARSARQAPDALRSPT